MRMIDQRERGDTIIEVLLAMTVLASVLTICISLMNHGFSLALSSMDRTNVQALMNGQASLLRVARDKYVDSEDPAAREAWETITKGGTPPSGYVMVSGPRVGGCDPGLKRFFFNPKATITPTSAPWRPVNASNSSPKREGTYPQVGDGMWIEAYKVTPPSGPAYYDFYIKSCWHTSGSGIDQEAKMIVRLYAN